MIDIDPPAIAALPPAYHALLARVVDVIADDERIRGVWLSGSLARGTADAGSDLDLLVAIRDQDFDAFAAGWRDWLATITPILIGQEIPRSQLIFTALTEDMCRIDAVLEPVGRLPESPHRTRIIVLDRDGLDDQVPSAHPGPAPDPDKITMIITEFWRQQAIFPAMIDGRQDLLSALMGIENAWRLLYDVFVESNQPLPPMGVKQVSSRLTAEQIAVLSGLPAVGADRAELITANRAVRAAMDTAGRSAAVRAGATYPDRIAAMVSAHLEAVLGR